MHKFKYDRNAINLKEIRVHKTKGSIAGSPWRYIYGESYYMG